MKYLVFAGIIPVFTLLLELFLLAYIPVDFLSSFQNFILLIYIVPLLVFSIPIGSMLYSLKSELLYREKSYSGVVTEAVFNSLNLIAVSIVGGIVSLIPVISPIYPLALAATSISGYNAIEAFAEAVIRMRRWRRFLMQSYRIYLLLVSTLVLAYLAGFVMSPLQKPLLMALVSSLAMVLVVRDIYRISKQYILYGLKYCVYCENPNPMEAIYCAECGFRLKK
ncbi:MAG: zinc ribbon domain-containing protein [Thermoproteales archaeon]|nr:zinc ribbon domain-containing protein [Thermoproteales archaeon]RLE67172.1 MAG: hypothetical protein DRJ47_00520 [Thermoprotei archaeon]